MDILIERIQKIQEELPEHEESEEEQAFNSAAEEMYEYYGGYPMWTRRRRGGKL